MYMYRIRPWQGKARRAWDPWRNIDELRQAMEQIAAQAAASARAPETGSVAPVVDLFDVGGVFVVRVDLPGTKSEDLAVTIEDGLLKIEGQRAAEGPGGDAYLCCERPTGGFVRALRLPGGVDGGSAKATLGDGVLEIILPKGEPGASESVVVEIEVVDLAEQPAPMPHAHSQGRLNIGRRLSMLSSPGKGGEAWKSGRS